MKITDKNGIEIKTGDIVKIEGGYFKADNGTFIVKHTPGDPSWSGNDYGLHKCNKKCEESNVKGAVAFWPLMVTVNSQEKRWAAKEHNKANATIEIIGQIKIYDVIVKQRMWYNDYETRKLVTKKEYQELLELKHTEVEILSQTDIFVEEEKPEVTVLVMEEIAQAKEENIELKVHELNKDLIHRANYNSFGGKRGEISNDGYNSYADKIKSWEISSQKKQKILDELYKKWSEMLKYESQHVSVMVAGPARYNSKKLDKGDKILELSAEFCNWFKELEKQAVKPDKADKATKIIQMIELWDSRIGFVEASMVLSEVLRLASVDSKKFIEYFEKLQPKYKWRKNTNAYKLYEQHKAGTVKEVKKEVIFDNADYTAFAEGDRAYIKFVMKPQRQLIVALKSRKWWWNSRVNAWSTYINKLDREWVSNISSQYAKYV